MPKYDKKVNITFNDGGYIDLVWYEKDRSDENPVSYFMNGQFLYREREESAEQMIKYAHRNKLNVLVWD